MHDAEPVRHSEGLRDVLEPRQELPRRSWPSSSGKGAEIAAERAAIEAEMQALSR